MKIKTKSQKWAKFSGFTLIEVIIFIVLIGIMAATILFAALNTMRGIPTIHHQAMATQAAARCIDWYYGQRRQNGYASIIAPSTSVPAFCTVPAGFTIATNVVNTALYGETAANYKTITVTVSGNNTRAIFSLLVASY